METIILYYAPGSCARVTLSALEETQCVYEDRALNLYKGEQKQPEYLSINPKGQVPALVVGDSVLTENPAILSYLNARFPEAGLFPDNHKVFNQFACISDLMWFSGTLHAQVRQIIRPSYYTSGDEDGVRALGKVKVEQFLRQFDDRFAANEWWYGSKWSIADVYAFWLTTIVEFAGMDISAYAAILRHRAAVRARPSFQRALNKELAAVESKSITLRLPAGVSL